MSSSSKKSTKNRTERAFYVEPLEPRLMLSGNVLALLIGGDLWVQGDELDNDVSLELVDDQVFLVGNNDTTINGEDAAFSVTTTDAVDGDIRAFLLDGDDQFTIGNGIQVGGRVRVSGGGGDDTIGLEGIQTSGTVRIRTGSGNDSIAISDTQLERLRITSGSGEDLISVAGTTIERNAVIATGSGNDNLVVSQTSFERNAILLTGSGDDNLAILDGQIANELKAVTGSDDDVLRIEDAMVGGPVRISQNSGDDAVQVLGASTFSGVTRVSGGSGEDQLELADAVVNADEISVFSFAADSVDAAAETRIDAEEIGALAQASELQSNLFGTSTSTPPPTDTPTPAAISLTLDTSSNNLIQSNGIQIAQDSNFAIAGQVTAGALIELDSNGDGLFNDGTATADENGDFQINTTLVNLGVNELSVRSTDADGLQTVESLAVHYAVGILVRYSTSLGSFDIELLNQDAPETVANFLTYVVDGFENSIIHRSPGTGFVIQGGGFTVADGAVSPIETRDPIASEFNPDNSNLRGTLSTALLDGDPDSATSGFFINTGDNAFLDAAGHTVFGRVIGEGLDVVDAIDQLPSFDLAADVNPAFAEIPLQNFPGPSAEITGSLSATLGSTVVTGTGTAFESELAVGDSLAIGDQVFTVGAILSDTSLVIGSNEIIVESFNQQPGFVDAGNGTPTDDNFIFLDINVLGAAS